MIRVAILCAVLVAAEALVLGRESELNVITAASVGGPFLGLTEVRAWVDRAEKPGPCWPCTVRDAHRMVDGSVRTVMTTPSAVQSGLGETVSFTMEYDFHYRVEVHRYKIHVGEGTPEEWHPRSWVLKGVNSLYTGGKEEVVLDSVSNANFGFRKGAFVGTIRNPGKYARLVLQVTEDSTPGDGELRIKIAELEALGPRAQYDLNVEGGYQCADAPRYITKAGAKKGGVAFTNTNLTPDTLKKMFNDRTEGGLEAIHMSEAVPAILGYHFTEAVRVVQFGPNNSNSWRVLRPLTDLVGRFVLEGHACDPTCDYQGDEGWAVLSDRSHSNHYSRMWLVERPGFYRAYRLKIMNDNNSTENYLFMNELHLLQC